MRMPSVILKNTERRTFVASMYHEIFCRRAGKCACSVRRMTGPKGKAVSVKSPASFHVFAKEESRALPMEVLHLPQVKAARASGWLKVVESKEAPKPVKAVVTPEAPKPKKDKKDRGVS
jgi:hypothetical protein